jgi:predicted AlkP superfamily phosphohydrolase/phosphomutase
VRAMRRNGLVARLVLVLFATAVAAGCSSDATKDTGVAQADKDAVASLRGLGAEVAASGGAPAGKRVIVLGIDGMDYRTTVRLMEEGKLPTFKALADAGGFSPLYSSIPPQSPVAWSNFITGENPGGHGIFDFVHRDPATYVPYLSISKVVAPPDKARLLGIPVKNKFAVPFSDYVFPLAGGTTLNLRRGVAFWQVLDAAGIPCTIFKVPSNFPPVVSESGRVKSVAGMGTPDILGTYGTFSFYTAAPWEGPLDVSGGYVYPVEVEDGVVHATLHGPVNDFRNWDEIARRTGLETPYQEKKVGVDFEVAVDPENPVAKVVIGGREVLVTEGEFSDWVEVEFEMVPHVVTVSGLVRFFLKSAHPDFELYASPIQINPADQILPVTDPPEYGRELVDAVGYFYTQTMPQDTKALEHGVFGNAEFAKQADLIFNEELRGLEYELGKFKSGLLYYYLSSLDQCQHVFWRCKDPTHPAYDPVADPPYAKFLDDLYVRFDEVLSGALDAVDDNTTIIVLSDHGFAPFYRQVHLNRWLYDQGYLVLKDGVAPEDVEWLFGVDWSRTRAYCLGINALYVNMAGREGQGIVAPADAPALVDEIAAKLGALTDPEGGKRLISNTYKARDVYSGPYASTAPDIIVGYDWGYRGSDDSATGKIPPTLVSDNTSKWSGDHCADYKNVVGVLFSNKRIAHESPALYDLAPSILSEFGIAKRSWMVGEPVF